LSELCVQKIAARRIGGIKKLYKAAAVQEENGNLWCRKQNCTNEVWCSHKTSPRMCGDDDDCFYYYKK